MSYNRALIEAQLSTSLHEELLSIEKQASAITGGAKAGVKGVGFLARHGGKALKTLKNIPGRLAYRATGWKGKGFKQMSKVDQLKRLEDLGETGAKGVTGSREELAGMAAKAQKGEGFMAGHKAKKVDKLIEAHGSIDKIPEKELAGAFGSKGKEILARGEAFDKGITNVPGYLRHAVRHPLDTARIGWHQQGRFGKTMQGGFAAMGAHNVATAPEGERLKTLAEELPANLLYAATGPLGFAGQMIAADLPAYGIERGAKALLKRKAIAQQAAKIPTPNIIRRAASVGTRAPAAVGRAIPRVAPAAQAAGQVANRVGTMPIPERGRLRTAARFVGSAAPPVAPQRQIVPRRVV